jgi:hypothetical protein
MLLGAAAFLVLAGAALVLGGTGAIRRLPVWSAAEAREVRQSRPPMAPRDPAPRSPETLDLSAPLDIGRGDCSFGAALDGAVRNMIVYEGTPPVARAGAVNLAGRRMTPRLTSTRDEGVDRPDFRSHDASVLISPAAIWNGLRLTGLRARAGWEWRAYSLQFAERPARVQANLRAMGIAMPLPPRRRDIPIDECSASIAIEAWGRGSALTCSSGC